MCPHRPHTDGAPDDRKVGPRRWGVLILEVPRATADEIVGMLGAVISGAEAVSAPGGRTSLRVYFNDPGAARETLRVAESALRASGLDPANCGLRLEEIEEGRWVERYQASLKPFPLGRGFRVYPAGGVPSRVERGERVPIRLIPGRAFGTGEHPTTRLCVELLEELTRPGSRWLDLGCGSAILSIVALRCGAEEVAALDSDPLAIEVAREVIIANGLGERITVRVGSADDAGQEWDGVVANIERPFFIENAPRLATMLAPGGALVASGILETEGPGVVDALIDAGLRFERSATGAAWCAVVLRRPED